MRKTHIRFAVAVSLLLVGTSFLPAQQVDLAITSASQRSILTGTAQGFWAQGASLELGLTGRYGLGAAANITGVHTGSIASSGVPLSEVIATFGPRYRLRAGKPVSVYGEVLLGEVNAFRSVFPSTQGAGSSANSLALRVGGGLDVRLSRHLALRVLDANWLRTQLPNGMGNRQNHVLLGCGLTLRSGS